MEVDAQIFPREVALAFQVEFFHGPNVTFLCTSDEEFIMPLTKYELVPFVLKVEKNGLPIYKIPVKGIISVILKIYYRGNFIRAVCVGDENYNLLNEGLIPIDLTAKPANSRKRAREPDHEIEWSDVRSPEEDMNVSNVTRWRKKNYTNFAELSLVVQNIGSSDGTCELMEYECAIHTENKVMQYYILDKIKHALQYFK